MSHPRQGPVLTAVTLFKADGRYDCRELKARGHAGWAWPKQHSTTLVRTGEFELQEAVLRIGCALSR